MSERIHSSLTRRTLIATLASGALAVPTNAVAQSDGSGTYSVEQGGECITVTPLKGSEAADAFYDWRKEETHYSSAGTTDLQRNDTTILFLYEAPDGTVSLVIVHEKYHGENDGGSASFEIRGLPPNGSWVVKDDYYQAPTNYDVWNVGGSTASIDWTWAAHRTDGGVYSPVGDDPNITIEPMFNESAALFGEHYDGRVRRFEVLSGDIDNPERHQLAMDETLTIRGGACKKQPEQPEVPEMPSKGVSPVDISLPKTINADSNGFMMVEIRSTGDFDVGDLNFDTLELDGASPVRIQKVPGREDVIRIFFRIPSMDLDGAGTRELKLRARGKNGERVLGSQRVRFVSSHGSGDDENDDGNTQQRKQQSRTEHTQNGGNGDGPGNSGDHGKSNGKSKKKRGNGKGKGKDNGNDAFEVFDDENDGDGGDGEDGNRALDLLDEMDDDDDDDDDENDD